jgi:hypothetical protein
MRLAKKKMRWAAFLIMLLPLATAVLVLSHGATIGDSHAGEEECHPCSLIEAVSSALLVAIALMLMVPAITQASMSRASAPRAAAPFLLLPQRAPPSC